MKRYIKSDFAEDEEEYISDLSDEDAYELFSQFFDEGASKEVAHSASDILKDWYTYEEATVDDVDRDDILAMLDAADDYYERGIVFEAMGYPVLDPDEDEEDW